MQTDDVQGSACAYRPIAAFDLSSDDVTAMYGKRERFQPARADEDGTAPMSVWGGEPMNPMCVGGIEFGLQVMAWMTCLLHQQNIWRKAFNHPPPMDPVTPSAASAQIVSGNVHKLGCPSLRHEWHAQKQWMPVVQSDMDNTANRTAAYSRPLGPHRPRYALR